MSESPGQKLFAKMVSNKMDYDKGFAAGKAEAAAENKRLREALAAAVNCVDGLMADFDGTTDNPNDPQRTHAWEPDLQDRFDWLHDAHAALSGKGDA